MTHRSPPAHARVSDDCWALLEPLLPPRTRAGDRVFRRRPGAGRKPLAPRCAFDAILYVLRTGTPWKSLPREFGSASAVHRHFRAWQAAGFFDAIWRRGLAEHPELAGIAWSWRPASPDSLLRCKPLWEPAAPKRRPAH